MPGHSEHKETFQLTGNRGARPPRPSVAPPLALTQPEPCQVISEPGHIPNPTLSHSHADLFPLEDPTQRPSRLVRVLLT